MLFRKPRVGAEITTLCGRCKEERTHTITAMDGEAVRKVTCNMCGSLHNYKQKAAAAAATPKKAAPRAGGRSKAAANVYSIDASLPVKPYNMDANFAVGEVVSHPKFGLGTVEAVNAPNKIEVRFQEGRKMLLHNTQR